MENKIKVNGMSCNHCKMSVEKAISNVEGVDSVKVDLNKGYADVKGDYKINDIKKAVENVGYEVVHK